MSRPSKFTADRRAKILELLSVGASRRLAAEVAGVDHSTLGRWLGRGSTAREGSRWRAFYLDALQAEARPRLRALKVIYDALPDDPALAWKFIERTEPGFGRAPIPPDAPLASGPTVIQLHLGADLPDLNGGHDEDHDA